MMVKYLLFAVLVSCGQQVDSQSNALAAIDTEQMNGTIVVHLTGPLGFVSIPLTESISVTEQELIQVLIPNTMLIISSDDTGLSYDILDATLVEDPTYPSEFGIYLNSQTNIIGIAFVNQTIDGRSMSVGGNYSGLISLSENGILQSMPPTLFDIRVTSVK